MQATTCRAEIDRGTKNLLIRGPSSKKARWVLRRYKWLAAQSGWPARRVQLLVDNCTEPSQNDRIRGGSV